MIRRAHLHAVGAQEQELRCVAPRFHPADARQVALPVKLRPNELRDRHHLPRMWIRIKPMSFNLPRPDSLCGVELGTLLPAMQIIDKQNNCEKNFDFDLY